MSWTGRLGLCATALLAACSGPAVPAAEPGPPVSLVLPALGGGAVNLQSYRGRAVVLHFFTTWDTGAQLDVDQLRQLAGAGRRVAVVGVALDLDGAVIVRPWQRGLGVSYPLALATDAVRLGQTSVGDIRKVPTTLILDRAGAVRHRIQRPLRPGELERLVAPLAPREPAG